MKTKILVFVALISLWLLTLGGCEVSTGVSKEISASISYGNAKVADLPGASLVCSGGVAKGVEGSPSNCVTLSDDGTTLTNSCEQTVSIKVKC